MTLRPVRFVAVSVLTCAFVLTGCTSGSGSAPGASGAPLTLTASRNDADHTLGEFDDLASTWVWK